MNNSIIKISKMTGKLEGIPAINTNTLSNAFCQKQYASDTETICNHCYSVNMLLTFRKGCVNAFEHNSKILSEKVHENYYLPGVNASYFRFSGHGELINLNHLINFNNICLKNPQTTFALWTKRKDLVSKFKNSGNFASNLILIFSNPKINSVKNVIPKHFHKVFNNVYADNKKTQGKVNCSQACLSCLKCYRFNDENIIIEDIKNPNGGSKKGKRKIITTIQLGSIVRAGKEDDLMSCIEKTRRKRTTIL